MRELLPAEGLFHEAKTTRGTTSTSHRPHCPSAADRSARTLSPIASPTAPAAPHSEPEDAKKERETGASRSGGLCVIGVETPFPRGAHRAGFGVLITGHAHSSSLRLTRRNAGGSINRFRMTTSNPNSAETPHDSRQELPRAQRLPHPSLAHSRVLPRDIPGSHFPVSLQITPPPKPSWLLKRSPGVSLGGIRALTGLARREGMIQLTRERLPRWRRTSRAQGSACSSPAVTGTSAEPDSPGCRFRPPTAPGSPRTCTGAGSQLGQAPPSACEPKTHRWCPCRSGLRPLGSPRWDVSPFSQLRGTGKPPRRPRADATRVCAILQKEFEPALGRTDESLSSGVRLLPDRDLGENPWPQEGPGRCWLGCPARRANKPARSARPRLGERE